MTIFEYSDTLGPTGEWKGGRRYGLQTERIEYKMEYTDRQLRVAWERGITLPHYVPATAERWFDHHLDHEVRATYPNLMEFDISSTDDTVRLATRHETAVSARQYGRIILDLDPREQLHEH